jgi:hypothetical protein
VTPLVRLGYLPHVASALTTAVVLVTERATTGWCDDVAGNDAAWLAPLLVAGFAGWFVSAPVSVAVLLVRRRTGWLLAAASLGLFLAWALAFLEFVAGGLAEYPCATGAT